MKNRLIILAAGLVLGASLLRAQAPPGLPPGTPGAEPAQPAVIPDPQNGMVGAMSFPSNQVVDFLDAYEKYTGKVLLRDAALGGPPLTLITQTAMPVAQAVQIIEALLLLNGYTLVPGPANTMKVLSAGRPPGTQALPLYTDVGQLPEGDVVVNFFLQFQYLEAEEADPIVRNTLTLNAYGKITAVTNAKALVISDTTPVIRQAVDLRRLIDVAPARLTTEFIPLRRADAERVVEALKSMIDQNAATTQSKNAGRRVAQPQGDPNLPPGTPGAAAPQAQGKTGGAEVAGAGNISQLLQSSQFYADTRTNRILVITQPIYFEDILRLINSFDEAVDLSAPYVRALEYVRAQDILQTLADLMKEAKDEEVQLTEGQTGGTGAGASRSGSGRTGSGRTGSGGSGGGGNVSSPDLLSEPEEDAAPDSAIVGKTKLIADKRANTIMVFGPPESVEKAKVLIEQLDTRPRQIYLATVIGRLRLTDGLDTAVTVLKQYTDRSGVAAGSVNTTGNLSSINPLSLITASAFPVITGGSLFGSALGDVLNYYVTALETTGRFQAISRPSIFTENNRKASILNGERIAVPSSSLRSVDSGSSGDTFSTNIQYEEVVLKLEVVPLITPSGDINLKIAQINDSVNGYDVIEGVGRVPRIATQEIQTTVTVPNNGALVLGGLITEEDNKNVSGGCFPATPTATRSTSW
jgi:general secretion pathway protein D